MTRRPRPKVVAAGGSTVATAILVQVLRWCGVDVQDIDPLILVAAGGGLATAAAYVKRDGLGSAWDRIVRGVSAPHPPA